jgi:hypothetical protein
VEGEAAVFEEGGQEEVGGEVDEDDEDVEGGVRLLLSQHLVQYIN